VFTLPRPDPFNGETFTAELSAAGLGQVTWAAEMDGGLLFDTGDALRPLIGALLAAHDGADTPPPPSPEQRIAELEAAVAALTADNSTPG
jgi:hypothetical protein